MHKRDAAATGIVGDVFIPEGQSSNVRRRLLALCVRACIVPTGGFPFVLPVIGVVSRGPQAPPKSGRIHEGVTEGASQRCHNNLGKG